MQIVRTAIIAASLLVAAASPALADYGRAWEDGQAAFVGGDYRSALESFQAARDAGLEGPAVHYNIAVCQFSLGQYEAARDSFRYIAAHFPRMRGLAEYNMGLAERRLGNMIAAQQHFIRAFELSPDDATIRALSVDMLRETDTQRASKWYGSIGMRAGHDDNVALRDTTGLPVGVTAESPMADLFASIRGPLPGIDKVLIDASAYVVRYPDASDYDQLETRLGVLYTWQNDHWWVEGGAYFAFGTLGGSSFNRDIGGEIRAVRFLDEYSSIEFQYRYDDVSAANAQFSGIDGDRQRVDLRYRHYGDRHYAIVRAGIENNDRQSASVSASRRRVEMDYRYDLAERWHLDAGLQFRASDYDDLATPRSEELSSVLLGVSRNLGDAWEFSVNVQYAENDSSDPVFTYERTQVTLGAFRTF